jgi:large subunit ribosomal protein L7/L12
LLVSFSAQAEPQHAIPEPSPDGQEKNYSEKISRLVDQIANLTLVEVSELNDLLKKRLNIPDVPMMGGFVAAAPGAAAAQVLGDVPHLNNQCRGFTFIY